MARKPNVQEPRSANLTIEQMRAAIPRIESRINDLEKFEPLDLKQRNDPALVSIENRIGDTISAIFGPDTVEYRRYIGQVTGLDTAGYNMLHATPMHEVVMSVLRKKETALQTLKDIKAHFEEESRLVPLSPGGGAVRAFSNLDLHRDIASAASDLYKNGHYANAIEDAVKALCDLVRYRSGIRDKDGTTLMELAFSQKNPVLKFNDQSDQSDLDEQKGFMMLMCGAVTGFRNPRAHKIINDDPESALEIIAFISLLAKLADKAKK